MFEKITSFWRTNFPERQVFHRAGGEVTYFTISPLQQMILTIAAAALLGWSLFASATVVFGAESYRYAKNAESDRINEQLQLLTKERDRIEARVNELNSELGENQIANELSITRESLNRMTSENQRLRLRISNLNQQISDQSEEFDRALSELGNMETSALSQQQRVVEEDLRAELQRIESTWHSPEEYVALSVENQTLKGEVALLNQEIDDLLPIFAKPIKNSYDYMIRNIDHLEPENTIQANKKIEYYFGFVNYFFAGMGAVFAVALSLLSSVFITRMFIRKTPPE